MIILGSASANFYLVLFLILTVVALAYLFYRFDYSFANIKRKILFKRKVENIRKGMKNKVKNVERDNKD